MAIEKIDQEKCTGCGTCVDTCPVDCLRLNETGDKATVRYPEECMLCGFCVAVCPEDAVVLSPHKSAAMTVSWG